MGFEPWGALPPEVTTVMLEGTSAPMDMARQQYSSVSSTVATSSQDLHSNAGTLATAHEGSTADAIASNAASKQAYDAMLQQSAATAGIQASTISQAAMMARLSKYPLWMIKANRFTCGFLISSAIISPANLIALHFVQKHYNHMWRHNAMVGRLFDSQISSSLTGLPSITGPTMSPGTYMPPLHMPQLPQQQLPGNSPLLTPGYVPSNGEVLNPAAPMHTDPIVLKALEESKGVASQNITRIDGIRGGGLGSGKNMPDVTANPATITQRGGVPSIKDLVNPKTAEVAMPGATSMGSGVRPGSFNAGSMSGFKSLSMPGSMGGVGGASLGGAGGTQGLGSLAGAGNGLGGGRGALGGMGSGSATNALGSRVGPAYSGVNAADRTLGNTTGGVGGQQRGMMGSPMRGRNNQDEEQRSVKASYIAREVDFDSVEEQEARERQRDDMFSR